MKNLCADIYLPDAALRQHIAILGKTGSGKTYTAKVIVERLLKANRRVAIIDPTGAWWGLRSSAGGDNPGYPVAILGGTHADAPLPPHSGSACAELITANSMQVVFDTTQFSVGERTRWFIDFANAAFRMNKGPLHLVIDECHVFAPQGKVPDPDTGRMLHAANQLFSGGRSRGFRLIGISQRPAKWHKDALTSCDTLAVLRLIAPQDRYAVQDWIDGCGDREKGKEVLDSLANLQRGEGWIWYPEGSVLQRVKFPRITTFDSSATPDDGDEIQMPKSLAEIDLSAIAKSMEEAESWVKENDPKELRKRIRELEQRQPVNDPRPLAELQERLENTEALLSDNAGKLAEACEELEKADLIFEQLHGSLGRVFAFVQGCLDVPVASIKRTPLAPQNHTSQGADVAAKVHRVNGTTGAAAAAKVEGPAIALSGPQQRVLNALAEWQALGVKSPNRFQVGFLAGYTATSGTFRNILAECRSAGLIDYPDADSVYLTPDGRAKASAEDRPTCLVDLWDRVESRLSGPQRRVFGFVVMQARGAERGRTEAAEACGYTASSGTWRNLLSEMKSLGLIRYPKQTTVQASSLLFPEGLR